MKANRMANSRRFQWIALVAALLILIIAGVLFMNGMKNRSDSAGAYNGHGGTFKNTLADFDTPDPSIAYKDGFYYMTFTHHGADIMVMKSRTLDFSQAERKVVWYPPIDTMYSQNIWAPEIQFIRDKWYIYFAADNGVNENHRMYALEAASDDPLGEYIFLGQVTDETNKWAIDGLAMEHAGQLYFVWSGWEGDVNTQQNTYIAPMSNPYTINGPRVLIGAPDQEWERQGGPPYIHEGQAILHKEGRTFIFYSGAGSWTPYYSIGVLALEPGADPLDASQWTKLKQPLMTMNEEAEVYGPGHNTFAISPDGTEIWNVYHGTSGVHDGWNNRKARAQLVSWDEDGMPILGDPLSLDTPIQTPSGSGVFRALQAQDEESLSFSHIPSSIEAETPVLVHYMNNQDTAITVSAIVNAGSEEYRFTLSPTKQGEVGYTYGFVSLQSGQNTIAFIDDLEAASIIAIEIPRFEAEYAQLSGNSELQTNPSFSNERSALAAPGDEQAIRFDHIHVPIKGEYTLTAAVSNPSDQKHSVKVSVNGESQQTIIVPAGERNVTQQLRLNVKLKANGNSIVFGDGTGELEFDYIEITASYELE